MPINPKVKQIYDTLKDGGADVGSEKEFNDYFFAKGKDGYNNRKKVFNTLKDGGADAGKSYEEFAGWLGLHAVKPKPATPQHTVQTTNPAPARPVRTQPTRQQKPQGKPMTAAQKAAAIGWAQGLAAQTKANTQRAMQKIKNIGKYQKAQGVYGQTKKGNIEYNPKTGKMEQTYLTPQGEQTTHKATADLASHEFRVQQGFLSRMSDNGLNPDNPEDVAKQRQLDKEHPIRDVLDSVWKEAEGIDKQAQEELRSKASSGFNLATLAEASNSAGAPLAGHDRNFNDELSYQEKRHKAFDFDKMANTIYSRLPKDYRNDRLREYTAYFSKHPKEAKGKSAVAAAKDALMGQIYNNVYSHAVQERLPKSNLEFLLRKVADQPLISSKAAAEFAASSRTGSHGLEVAERDAMAQFGSQHKAMNIMGTVANMALDPITYVSGGVGGFVGKKALGLAGKAMLGKVAEKATEKAVGKVATDVASRYAAGTLAGRVVQGVAGGAANFATFNTLKGIEEQVATGGVVNPETGKSEGFSVGEILKSTGHGLLLGAATGTLSPIIGNFADKAVKATTSTVGKVALRAGETAVSTLAEGTVFSIPEWISGQGDAFDVWTDNMGMMLGFKASHAIKSAPRVLDALRTDGKRYGFSFKERLNKQMEASPSDAGFTSEELDELRNNGYMDLSMLFRNAQKQKSTNPKSHEVSKEVIDDYENLTPDTFDGYEAMKRLMNDKGVSEATRAKAYYILTGRMLPMSTITGYTMDKTEDGDIVVKSMSAQGDVVTSRQFTNEKAAQGEIDKIMRQSELNSVDVGEKYKETASNMLVVETAIKEVAPDADMETVLQNYRKVKSGQEDMPQELIDQAKAIDAAIERNRDIADANRPEAIREKLNKETGLDVDATLRKMPKDRTEEEKGLVDTYIKSLFPEQEKTEDGQTADVQADTEYKQRIEERQQAYDEGKEAFNVADTEGDNSETDAIVLRYREAYDEIERVFADDAEMRIAQLEEDPWEVMNDQSLTPEQQDAVAYFVNSKAAMDGLTEAANENSENKRAEAEYKIAQRTNRQSGMIHPATLKVDDKQVYIVIGNVTMLPDGSTVDIHHSSENLWVCDAETGEIKPTYPGMVKSVDEPIDPGTELKAVDEAINAEQQAILGNEAETEVSETEEMPEQEENEQPQPIQQDDAVEETNLDVQNESEVNLPQSGNIQQNSIESEVNSPQNETDVQEPSALNRIPKGDNGEPLYEQTEPETAWDAIVEQTEGDTSMAQTVVDDMVSDLEAGVKKAEKSKTKRGGSISEKIAAEKERAAVIEQAKATLAHWRKIAAVNRMREAAIQAEEQRKADEVARVRKEQEEKERVEQEEAERIKREALNGVPDFVEDKATDARARGYRRVNGDKVDRQEPINATKGKEVQVKFDDDNIPTGHVAIIEANQLQPSHKNGQRNPQHFIDEAQPKERKDDASVGAARKIAANIRPEEITSSVTAYTGAPTVNSRGEVIQGNNRSAALREMWDNYQEQGDKYKQYLIDNAESFGLRPEDIAAMDKPVLVNMLDVNDDEAISLGQFVASDTESGGTERIKPKNVVKKLGDKMKNFANILLRANDENISFAELVDSNGVNALKWLNANGVISPAQYKSAFDSKGNITAEAKNDIKGIMYQSIFEGGNTQLEEMFNTLPAKAQKAILATAYRDYDSPQSERMIGDIQDSIMAYYALSHDSMFMNAKNHKDARIAVEAWRRQLAFDDVTGESYLPAEKYSNFALLLATMYKGDNQSLIQGTFNRLYDLIQGTQEETLFEQPDNTPRSLAQAIKETLNIEYNGQQGSNVLAGDNSASQGGRTGSNGDATPRGRSEDIDGAEANQGGTERDSGRSGEKRVETVDEGAYSLSQQKSDNGENFYQDINGNIDLANIPDEVFNKINKPQAPFRLTPSMLKHVFDRHGKEMGLSKADDAIDFVLDVIDNFDHVRQGEKGAIIFSIENGRSRTGRRAVTVLLDSLSGSYYGIKTSGYERIEGLAKRTLLWEKGAKDTSTTGVAPANVSTEQASQSNEPAGSASNHNNEFEGKDKQSSDTKQENVDNYLEKPARDEDLFTMAERVAEEDKAKRTRKKEAAKVDTNPTEAQKEAGNYRKGHIIVDGYDITLENPKGSTRSGKDANGKEWSITMKHDYGYIRGTKGTDGDHIDVYLSDNPTAGNVYVVDQIDQQTGDFDEHKVMYGFNSMEEAVQAYRDQYEDGWKVGTVTEVSREEFKKWVDSSVRKTKPFAEYKSVKSEMGVGFDTEHTQAGENYAHNSEEIMHEDVKPVESSEKYTITPTQYTNKKGKTSGMYLVKFNHELSKEEKAAAKTFISEPLAEGKRTPRGWYDREQEGYMVRSEDAAKQLGDMMSDEVAVADEQPLTVQDYRNAVAPAAHKKQEKKPSNTVSVEDTAIQDVDTKVYNPKDSGLDFNGDVSKEDFNDALKDLRSLLGVSDDEGDVGILFRDDDELTKEQRKKIKAAGLSVTQVLVDNGMVKFSDYANKMVSLIGDKIRPWLKSFYEGIRWEPGYESVEFTPSDEVARFDVQNFDKPTPDVLKQAEMVVAEQKAAKISKQTEQEVRTERNEKRKEDEKQAEANTTAITEEAGAVASKARTVAKRATTHTEVRKATEEVETALEKVNNQLALLGYYEAEKVAKDFNEAYGYMRNAEKKAVKDATTLAKRIADDLGVDIYEATHTAPGKNGKRKSKPLAVANIAPIGGEITIHLPLEDGKNLSIYIILKANDTKGSLIPGDNLEVGNIMYRLENPAASGQEQYGVNNFADPDITYNELIEGIRRITDSTEVRDKSNPDIKSYLAEHLNSIAKDKSIQQIINPATGNSEEVIRDYLANELPGYVIDHFTNYADPKVKTLLEYVTGDTSLSKEENKKNLDLIIDALIDRTRSILKDGEDVEEFHGGELQDKGKARLSEHAEEVKEKPTTPDLHGFNIGDKVMYKGKEATLYDTDNGRPVLDAGLAPVMYEVTNWEELSPVTKSEEAIPTKEEKVSTEKEKPTKKNNSKKKSVSLKREPTVGDLFGDLFDNNDLDSKDNDTARTRQAESSSRENGTVGSISTERDGVLDTRSTGTADGGATARVSDTAGAVADGERKELPRQRSSRSTSGGNHGDGEAERPMPERGQRIGDRDDANGRSAIARATDESQRTSRPAAGSSERLVHGEARRGGRGGRGRNVASAKQPEPKFKRNYLYPEDSSEVDNMTPQQRLRSNVEALEVVRTLMKEGREATADERDVLGRYRGWGGVDLGRAYSTDMMRRSTTGRWGTQTENDKLLSRLADIIDELDPDGKRGVLSAINHAALTSYYTPTAVAKTLNDFVKLAGFKGGNMLDPSMGSGIFEGTMSKAVQQRTMIHGIELDWLTGQIARNLYPDANVLVTGYEQAGTADNAYDVVMSNTPFGDLSVTDKTWKHDSSPVRKAAQNRIHNYFAVKMLDNTRPGGLCVIMTSNAILDTKSNQIIREHLADKAEVLGVVRLPDNTFKGAGTSVVTDVILLRKYKNEADRIATRGNEAYTTNIEKPFLSSGELQLKNPTDGKTYNVTVNGYFTKNKDMMIGDGKAGGQYRADEFGLSSTMGTDDIAKVMGKLVEKKIIGDRKGKLFDTHKTEREVKQAVSEAYKGDGNYISSGNIVEQDGMIGVVTITKNKYGDVTTTFNEIPSLKGKAERIGAMLPIRKAMKQLIDMQIQGVDNNHLEEARTELQNTYDAFVRKYGRLNDKTNDFLTKDIDGYTLRSLEKYKDSKFIGLSDIFTKNTIKPALDMTTAKTPQDAISLSLAEYGEIKPSFMKDVLGESWAEQCGDILFKTPFTDDEYETVDAYLSGDVKTKLEQARAAAKEDATLQRNVDALEAVQPKDIPFEDISIRMGARWIPAEVYTDFMYEQFGIPKYIHRGNKSGVEYLPEVDQYVVNVEKKELGGEADAWRTSRRSASEVFTAALQDKSLSVFDTIKEGGKETKVLNKEETELLNNKIQDLRTAFEDWIGQNPEREEMLMQLYNDKFNRIVLRKFDGSHLNVAGLMGKELRPHQKDAVWMLINNRGGIVDHIVGAGKTLVMQSAIMEMRRMGIAKKPMIIALKSTVAQIAKEFREAYPAARILAPTEKDFDANNRKKFMAQIALNDYDCVILSHDQYDMLPHTEEVERSVIDEQMAQLDNAIEFLYGQDDKSQLTKKQIKGLEKRKNNLETKLTNLLDRKIDREFTFEGLGVDYLFVDECQHFKSLPYVSTYDRVAGLGDKKGSQKAIALLNGVRYLQKMHQGDQGTVFLSGTTISNSLSEIYHLLNYLRPSEMERLGMTTFDAWAGNFAIHTAELEYGVTSELKEKDRFRSLTNIPELAKMYAEIADIRNDLNLKLPKPKMRSHIVTVPQTDLMQEINREIVNMVKNKNGRYFNITSKENTPWGLLASTLSAKAAINPRLIDESWETEGGKIPAVCENVKKIYDQFAEQKGTQLIFCDTGVPGKGKKYDAYSDIINRLVNDYGIPRKEIADIHEANTDEKRKELFAKVNDGSVRILIGGTKNMGTGVNVQKRIVAMHHVDVPWTPADREQREGRGVRQGNEIARDFNDDNVDVYFYATEGSLDMYKYQLQETKGKLFAQFKSGTIGDRTFDEGDAEENFDPAEVVAMLSGNPVIFEKSKQDKKVEKLRRAKRAYESDWQRRHARYEELQTKKRNYERLLSLNASDAQGLERGGFTADAEGKYPSRVTVSVKDDYSSRKTFEKPKEAGAYIHELLKQGKKVQLSGFHQTANISIPITDAGLFGKPVAELESYGGIKYAVEVSDDDTAAGVAFRNLLQKVYNNRKVYERNIEDVNNQLKGADPGENAFPKQAELDEALKEKKRLDEEYKKLSDEEDKPSVNNDTRYRDFDEEVNEQFNRELAGLTEENADTKIFNLGSPSSILLSAGIEDKPMKLYGNKVIKKMKKHGFALEELQDLPRAVANPIAVFNNYQREGNRTILTELRSQGKNIMVAITLGKDGVDVDFNIVSSVFGKGSTNIVDWISKGYLAYVDKEKALNYLYFSESSISEAADNVGQEDSTNLHHSALSAEALSSSRLSSAAKIVKDFVNPNIGEEKTSLQGKIDPQDTTPQAKALQAKMLSEKLNTPIRVVSEPEEIAELPSRRQQRAKGWWSAKNDEVVILLPNNADVADVANTAVHEVVGHKGLRKLIGEERFDEFLDEVYDHATNPIRTAIDEAERKLFDTEVDRLTQQKNAEAERPESRKGVFSRAEATVEANKKREQMRREATEEYMADMAGRIGDEGFEKMSAEELTFWGKVKAKVQQFLDKFLRGLKIAKGVRLTDKDVAYILYKSWKNLRNGGKPTIMDAAEDALMRNKTNYNESDISRFRDGDMGLDETITNMKAEISAANKDDFNAKVEAMKAIGGNLQKLRSAMSRQRSYDISTAKAMTDLAQVLLDKGLLDNLSVYETKRVLSAVRNGVGKEDISGHVQKLMDIMVDNQLHSGANMLGKLFTMRGTRLNDRGIEVQGNLDPQGQILVKTARKYTSFPKEEIDNTLIPDLMSRMGSDYQTIADNAAIEYAGAQIARRYVEEITESKVEEKALRESIKTAKEDKDAGKLDAEAYKQYVNATEETIRQNKIDRAEAYSSIAAEFGGMLGESAKRANEWRKAEQERINDIHHNCNSDMEGRITDEHHKDNKVQKLMNNDIVRFFLAPLGTFDQMLRMFGKKNVNGEGYLWNRFMRSWVDATENEYTGYRDDLKELDAKVSEVYGKKMKWADLFTLERKMGKVPVEFWDGGERKLHELTQGNLLYIYMVDKMSDGRMKLRYMGITEQDVQHITEILDPKFKELADWLQDEYLVNKRNKYNEVHKRMFGAPMAAIDNYFPLKILKNALDKEEDVAEDDNAGIVLPGTTTNGIIKRTRNNKPLDVTGADAFNVIADHLQEMEHWAAFAELTRDINTMLSYKRFRNQVMNMSSAYGAGAVLWKNFRNVCKMAVGAYRPPIAGLDKTAVNVAKGVTAAKVSFRVFTALKQFLSFPAYLTDASLAHLAKDVVNPVSAWKWSMKNLPIFEKRLQSRMAGDPRLMKSDMDWKAWRSRIVEIASMIGMSPNAFVDALTVAMGAHAMYQSRYAKYKRWGFDEVTADKRAKQDATILYNSTQQSSEGAFLSTMQVDRSWFTVLLSIFRNSSMSYERQEYDAFRNEVKLFTPGYRQRAEEFMIKQLQREGLTEEQAKKAAHGELRKGPLHNLARIFVFGFAIQAIWNLGAYLPYLLVGDDDDEKSKMTDDALTHALFGSLEGLTSGDVLSQAGNMALQGEWNWAQVVKDMPAASDFIHILKTYSKDNVEALNDCVNLLTQSAVGVNPQSITDAMVAIIDYCGDDAQTSRECALLMARILNCPQSQLDKIYFDELSASGVEASKMTPSQIAERFARYKRHRSAPLTGWMYSDAAIADKDGKRKETVYKKARENFKAAASKSNKEELEQWKAEYKETAAKLSAIKKLREQDEDEADEQMDALENTPEYDRYLIMKDYNSDMNDITKAWLNSKSPTEREQLTKAMFKVQQEMVNELKTSK